jgi:hypothetical protein
LQHIHFIMLKSRAFILFTVVQLLVLVSFFLFGQARSRADLSGSIKAKQELVSRLGLTDFAIWTEARYTRHPSQTDFFSPFQDFPSSPDHFPAGSIIAPVRAAQGATP